MALKILHLIRDIEETLPLEVAQAQRQQGHQVTLLLLHDAVLRSTAFSGPVFACRDDLQARGNPRPHATVDYAGIVQLIADHDRVISW